MNSYQVSAVYVDKNTDISQIYLTWASLSWQSLNEDGSIPEYMDLYYTTIAMEQHEQNFALENLSSGSRVWIHIEALIENEIILLDTLVFDTPPSLDAFLYIQNAGPNFVVMDGYFSLLDFEYYQMNFTLDLIQNGQILRTISIASSDLTGFEQEPSNQGYKEFIFNNLTPSSKYHVRMTAHYFDSLTNSDISEIVQIYDIYTTATYMLTMSHMRDFSQIEVTLNLNDPMDVFLDDENLGYESTFYYYVTMGTDYSEFVMSGSVSFYVEDISASFIINLGNSPMANYKIIIYSDISAGNPSDGMIVYYSMDVIIFESIWVDPGYISN